MTRVNESNQELLEFYTEHSKFSNPGVFKDKFAELPSSIKELCTIVQGLLIHEVDGRLFGIVHPPARFYELNLRSIEKMLERIFELDSASLYQAREPKKKLIATCRDFALLLVAMLRNSGVPARLRVGFATYTYTDPNMNGDHVVAEYWDNTSKKWIVVDSRISPYHIDNGVLTIDFDVLDVPETRFMRAEDVWIDCRSGVRGPNQYGFVCKSNVFKGFWYIRNRVMHDFAALNKCEMLVCDAWGYMFCDLPEVDPTDPVQLKTLDELAETVKMQGMDCSKLKDLWDNPSLRVPSIVITYDRYSRPHAVEVIDSYDNS